MSNSNIRRASLAEIRAMRERGEVYRNPNAPEGPPPGEELPEGFWDNAELVTHHEPKSVHLKLDSEVYEFFKSEGKGHITRMQNVLKAYVRARQRQQAGKAKKRA
jgi:uncharacterized protein (DUF4415 family)